MANQVQVQVFGRRDSRATQRALRFFSERRVQVTFVDMARKTMAPAELRRFARRLGEFALIDPESRPYRDTGMAYMSMDDEEVGVDEDAWRTWLADEVPGG